MKPLSIVVTKSGIATAEAPASINESGAYIGEITLARAIESSTGLQGIQFAFRSEDGLVAKKIKLWLTKTDGEINARNMGTVEAMAYLLGQKELNAEEGMISEFDYDSKTEVQKKAFLYKGLMNKKIGLLLQAEADSYNGRDFIKINLECAFHPVSRFTASEMIDKATAPQKLEKRIEALKPLVKKEPKAASNQASSVPASGSKFEDFEDDIPF